MGRIVYKGFNSALKRYFETGEYPETSDIDCCYCHKPYPGMPIPVVADFDEDTASYEVWRCACTTGCAKSYIHRTAGAWGMTLLMYQRLMLVEKFGYPINKPIQEARSLDELKSNGGSLSIEKWRVEQPPLTYCKTVDTDLIPHRVLIKLCENRDRCDPVQGGDICDEEDDGKRREQEQPLRGGNIPQAALNLENMTTVNLVRPPEEECIKTKEQLRAAHPDLDLIDADEGPFEHYIREHADELPSDAECERILAERKIKKQIDRKIGTEARKRATSSKHKT